MKYIIAFILLTFSVTANAAEKERFLTIQMEQEATLYLYGRECLIDRFTGGHAELIASSGAVLVACWIPNESTESIKVFYEDNDYYQYPMQSVIIHN